MKKLLTLMLLCTIATATFASGGLYIEFKMSASGAANKMAGNMKIWSTMTGDSRNEMEMNSPGMPNGGMHMVSIHKSSEPKKMYLINDATKTYSVIDGSKYEAKSTGTMADHTIEVQVIGNEKVNGYNATHCKILMDGKYHMDMWNTKEIPGYDEIVRSGSIKYASDMKMWQAMKDKGADGAPARMIVNEHGQSMQMDLVKAERADVTAERVTIPTGYKEESTANGMMRQMNMPSADEIMKMTPEQREKLMKEMQEKYKKQ